MSPTRDGLEVQWQEHDLGGYPTIVLTWEDGMRGTPWDYIEKCEEALTEYEKPLRPPQQTTLAKTLSLPRHHSGRDRTGNNGTGELQRLERKASLQLNAPLWKCRAELLPD